MAKQKINKYKSFWKLTTLFFFVLFAVTAFYHFNLDFNKNLNSILSVDKIIGGTYADNIFERDGKIYIGYDGPSVDLTILRDPKCTDEKACNIDNYIYVLKRDFTPLLNVEIKNFTDNDSRKLIKDLDIKALPAFIFNNKITEIANYK